MEGNDEGLTFQSYGETFKQLCPYYMSIGMSYAEFWDGDPTAVIAYRTANELQDKRRNFELWLQGKYVYDALGAISPLFRFTMSRTVKAEPYVKEPYPITEMEARQREEREARLKEERLKAEFALFAEQLRNKMPQEALPK